jgi:hypothetical protein
MFEKMYVFSIVCLFIYSCTVGLVPVHAMGGPAPDPSRYPTRDPSRYPTRDPSRTPSRFPTQPTLSPSFSPSSTPVDCTSGCSLISSGTETISSGYLYASVYLPRYFQLTFDAKLTTWPGGSSNYNNALQLVNADNGNPLIGFFTHGSYQKTTLFYSNIRVEEWGPEVNENQFTLFTITVSSSSVSYFSESDTGWIETASVNNVDTTGVLYNLFISNEGTSAGGLMKQITITRKYSYILKT